MAYFDLGLKGEALNLYSNWVTFTDQKKERVISEKFPSPNNVISKVDKLY